MTTTDIKEINGIMEQAFDASIAALEKIKASRKEVEAKYEALKKEELAPIEEEQQNLEKQIENLAKILGKPYRVKKKARSRSNPRIRTEDLFNDVQDIMSNGKAWPVKDLFLELYKRDYQPNDSTRSRTYAALSIWVKEGKLAKAGRGVYQLPSGGTEGKVKAKVKRKPKK